MKDSKTMRLSTLCALMTAGALQFAAPAAHAQRAFDSAEAAVKALIAAAAADDEAALIDIFGSAHRSVVATADKSDDRDARQRFAKAAEQYRVLRTEKDGRVTVLVGAQAWPLPIPLVQAAGTWKFDAAAGAEEMVNRRVGANELATIDALAAYGAAQRQYAAKPRGKSEVRQFAQRISSTPGRMDGLYWEADPAKGEEPSPFGPLVKDPSGRDRGDPYHGYYFKILKAQGAAAPGGRYSYVINGNMVAGFAMIAWPAEYGVTGAKTFIVNHYGIVYEKDLGPKTATTARAITEYNPDKTWTRVAD
jgi:hypothetical protein